MPEFGPAFVPKEVIKNISTEEINKDRRNGDDQILKTKSKNNFAEPQDNHSSVYKFVHAFKEIKQNPNSFVGRGAEKNVYNHPTDSDKIVAEFRDNTPIFGGIKEHYFLGKILHLLYPKNFPNVHFVLKDPPILVFDKVKYPEKMSGLTKFIKRIIETRRIECKLNELGLNADYNSCNLIFDKDKSLKYVDSVYRLQDLLILEKKIKQQLKDQKLELALSYLDRIRETRKKKDI